MVSERCIWSQIRCQLSLVTIEQKLMHRASLIINTHELHFITHLDRLGRFLQSLLMQAMWVPTNTTFYDNVARAERFSTGRTSCDHETTGGWSHVSWLLWKISKRFIQIPALIGNTRSWNVAYFTKIWRKSHRPGGGRFLGCSGRSSAFSSSSYSRVGSIRSSSDSGSRGALCTVDIGVTTPSEWEYRREKRCKQSWSPRRTLWRAWLYILTASSKGGARSRWTCGLPEKWKQHPQSAFHKACEKKLFVDCSSSCCFLFEVWDGGLVPELTQVG